MPMLGFLGTVLGMMKMFQITQANEYLSSANISATVGMALITTAAALSIAIPGYIAYNYLISRINIISLDMEKAALEIIAFFERRDLEKAMQEGADK